MKITISNRIKIEDSRRSSIRKSKADWFRLLVDPYALPLGRITPR